MILYICYKNVQKCIYSLGSVCTFKHAFTDIFILLRAAETEQITVIFITIIMSINLELYFPLPPFFPIASLFFHQLLASFLQLILEVRQAVYFIFWSIKETFWN